MRIRAGDRAVRRSTLRCENCGAAVLVAPGHRVPKCRGCGYAGFAGDGAG